jgi:hypothetical protein
MEAYFDEETFVLCGNSIFFIFDFMWKFLLEHNGPKSRYRNAGNIFRQWKRSAAIAQGAK